MGESASRLHAACRHSAFACCRGALAGAAGWQENRLAKRFPVDLGQPYFLQLMPKTGPDLPAVLRVFPYSFTVDEARDKGLATVAMQLLGKKARVMLRP